LFHAGVLVSTEIRTPFLFVLFFFSINRAILFFLATPGQQPLSFGFLLGGGNLSITQLGVSS
jgi:hypothetical protein